MNILSEIVANKKECVRQQKERLPQEELVRLLGDSLETPSFERKIGESGITLIAELKKASPSAGVIRQDFDCIELAQSYEAGGAGCLSVLTESKYFQGNLSFLARIREKSNLPLLRKDFIIDGYQLFESKLNGADAVLLITAILSEEQIHRFLELAHKIKLDVLLEVHSREELKIALNAPAKTIGINARNLDDFSVNLELCAQLAQAIPSDRFIVAESGIKTEDDIRFIKKSGSFNAVLVGEGLLRADDIKSKTKSFVDILKS